MTTQCMTVDVDGLKHGLSSSHRKEKIGLEQAWIVADPDKSAMCKPDYPAIEARVYQSGQTVTACVWIHWKGKNGSGSGRVGGGGYHKASAAIQAAIKSSGIRLSFHYDLCSDGTVADAFQAIGKALGIENPLVFLTHP